MISQSDITSFAALEPEGSEQELNKFKNFMIYWSEIFNLNIFSFVKLILNYSLF